MKPVQTYGIEWEHIVSGDRGMRPSPNVRTQPERYVNRATADDIARELSVQSPYYRYRAVPLVSFHVGPYKKGV